MAKREKDDHGSAGASGRGSEPPAGSLLIDGATGGTIAGTIEGVGIGNSAAGGEHADSGNGANPQDFAGDAKPKRKYTKRAKTSSDGQAAGGKTTLDIKAFAATLQFTHEAAAKFTGIPLLAIEKNEAESIAEAVANVFAQYEMSVSPKVMAWAQLIGVLGAIYGGRWILFLQMKAAWEEQQQKMRESGGAVVPINPGALN